jgi:hypothetical protein
LIGDKLVDAKNSKRNFFAEQMKNGWEKIMQAADNGRVFISVFSKLCFFSRYKDDKWRALLTLLSCCFFPG